MTAKACSRNTRHLHISLMQQSCICSQRPSLVFFASATWPRPVKLSTVWRLFRRKRTRFRGWFLAFITRTLTCSPIAHISIEWNGAVLDPGIGGNQVWATLEYIRHFPTLLWMVKVPVLRPPPIERYEGDKRAKRALPSIARWATRGRVRTNDCACTVTECLRDAGVNVPRAVVSPQQLFDWLTHEHGCEAIPLARPSA